MSWSRGCRGRAQPVEAGIRCDVAPPRKGAAFRHADLHGRDAFLIEAKKEPV